MQKKFHIDFCYMNENVYYNNTMLIQLGRQYCSPSQSIPKHAHANWYELTVVTDGRGTVCTNNTPSEVKSGDIYFSHPGDFHEIHSSEEEPLKFDYFAFNTRDSEIERELKGIVSEMFSYDERVFRNMQIAGAVSSAIGELSSNASYKTQIVSSLFEQILYLVMRNYSRPTEPASSTTEGLCMQIMHYIDTHIYTMTSLSVLSDKFSYNYSYLSNMFKNATGMTLMSYFRTRRLDAAKLLLEEKNLKINQVAEMLCYSSLYSFSKAFKEKYGVSPKSYRTERAKLS